MNRSFRLPEGACFSRRGVGTVILDFGEADIAGWVIELSLLAERLVSSFTAYSTKNPFRLTLRVGEDLPKSTRALVSWKEDGVILDLTPVELRAWLHFFLIYLRDGMGEVDHLDVNALPAADGEEECDLVLKIAQARPPVPGDVARRLLGL